MKDSCCAVMKKNIRCCYHHSVYSVDKQEYDRIFGMCFGDAWQSTDKVKDLAGFLTTIYLVYVYAHIGG